MAGRQGRVSVPRTLRASTIVCFSYQAVSQHHRLVPSENRCKVPALMLLTPGFAQRLPCICVANISHNYAVTCMPSLAIPRRAVGCWAFMWNSQLICSSISSPCSGLSCLWFSSMFLVPPVNSRAQKPCPRNAAAVFCHGFVPPKASPPIYQAQQWSGVMRFLWLQPLSWWQWQRFLALQSQKSKLSPPEIRAVR